MPASFKTLPTPTISPEKDSFGPAVILLFGDECSPCLRMAESLRAIGYRTFCISSKRELNYFISRGPTFDVARLDLTTFNLDDIPLLRWLTKRVAGNGLILWSTRTVRPDLDQQLGSFCAGVFVRIEY
jgi:hypothetical protein